MVFYVSDGSRSGNRGRIAGIQLFWLAASPWDGPHGLLETRGVAGGIRGLASGIFPFASHKYQGVAIRGKMKLRQGRTFVSVVFSQLTRMKFRRVSNLDISATLLIEGPGQTAAGFGRG